MHTLIRYDSYSLAGPIVRNSVTGHLGPLADCQNVQKQTQNDVVFKYHIEFLAAQFATVMCLLLSVVNV